jgi:hypothetical protein
MHCFAVNMLSSILTITDNVIVPCGGERGMLYV